MKNQETLDSLADALLIRLDRAIKVESFEEILNNYKQILDEYSEHLYHGFWDELGHLEADVEEAKRYKSAKRRGPSLRSLRSGLKNDIEALKTEVRFN